MGARQSLQTQPLLPPQEERGGAEPGRPAGVQASLAAAALVVAGASPLSVTSLGASKISIRNLSKATPEGQVILSDINIEVASRKTTLLVGPSGSGKSTTLRSLNRLWEPAVGSVFLDGCDITFLNVVQLRRRLGMVFQSAALFEGTVADNIRFGPSLTGRHLSDSEVEGYLRLADLNTNFAAKKVETLSGGQAQRVAIARTLANNPEVLLLDEPTSALDPAATLAVEQTVHKLKEQTGVTVVWVSHNVEQIHRVADQVILLVDGRVHDAFAPQDLSNGDHQEAQKFVEGKLRSLRSFKGENTADASGSSTSLAAS